MKTDNIRAMFTYLTAFTIVVGGFLLIYASRLDTTAATMQVLIGGFIGASISFLFNAESTKSATIAAVNATAAGQASQPTVTTTSGPPASVTVSAPTPIETDPLGADSEEPFGDAIG